MSALARVRLTQSAILLASLSVAALLAGCETPPAPPPPPSPVAAAPPPPPVLLPQAVIESASVYEAYIQRAGAIDAGFTGGESVAASLKVGETYQADQFQRGEAAYGAIVALQDPTFVASLRAYAVNADSRAQVANALIADPNYAATFKGADTAAGLVIAALSEHGRKLLATGAKIHQAAYDVQHQSWSKADVPSRDARLALAKSLSAEQQQAVQEDALRLSQAVSGARPMGMAAPPVQGPYTPLVARALAVAAMSALGEGGEEYSSQLHDLLTEDAENNCLRMAKLNLYQCLAVAKPHYEDVFCLGQHAVSDTGQCIMHGAQVAVALPPHLDAPAPAELKSVSNKKGGLKHKKKGATAAG